MSFSISRFAKNTFALSSFIIVASCAGLYNDYDIHNPDPIDRPGGLSRKDYIDQLTPKPAAEPLVQTKEPVVPKAADLILIPQRPRLGINKTVSISVTDDVPLKDVFIELARLADINIEVDSSITGGVIFKAKNMPFDEAVQRICDLAGLRYSIDNGVVKVEADKPYVENYQASYLNLIRKSTGRIDVDTKTLGNDNSSGSSGGGSGSSGSSGSSSGSGSGSSGSSSTSATGSQSSITSATGGEGDIWASIQTEVSAIINAPIAAKNSSGANGAPAANATASTTANSQTFVSLNREAGVISVRASAKDQEKVREYLKKVKDYYSSQVLIEAKVIEISLNDEYRSGVNWALLNHGRGIGLAVNTLGFPNIDITPAGSLATNGATAVFNYGDLNGIVQLAQVFGTTKTLSSPRIQVMNNQNAVLNFSVNENYFTVSCSSTATTAANSGTVTGATVTSTLHTIPIGIILGLQPAIDTVNNEVSMSVHPTLSRLTGVVTPDPAAAGCNAVNSQNGGTGGSDANTTITSSVPQVDIRELDSILKLKSGEVMAIGGMIDQKNNNTDSGIPYLSDIPVLGNAFKTVDKLNNSVQTVIFLKATIVPGYGVDDKDQQLYNKFNNDPHPLTF